MIARIVTGSGNNRRSFDLPCSSDRKVHVRDRIEQVGNVIKSKYLFKGGKGFKVAKARGEAAMAVAN